MKLQQLPAVAVCLLSGAAAFTVPAQAVSEHYYDFIGKVNIPSDGYLWINVPGNLVNDDNCQNPWYAISKQPLSNDITRAQLQVALASFLGRKKVYIRATGCTASGYLLLDTIQLEQP
jgi:hypothetical protein